MLYGLYIKSIRLFRRKTIFVKDILAVSKGYVVPYAFIALSITMMKSTLMSFVM